MLFFTLLTLLSKAYRIFTEVVCGVDSNIAVFRQPMDIFCELVNETVCVEQENRFWFGGKQFSLLSMGSTSVDQKYEEAVQNCTKYVLTIYNLSESDVDHVYMCSIGFRECSFQLNLTTSMFEYHPKDNEIITEFNASGALSLLVSITKVYPEPSCSLFLDDEVTDINVKPSLTMNGKFFQAEVRKTYESPLTKCPTTVNLTCAIGTTNVAIFQTKIENCTGTTSAILKNSLPILITCFVIGILCMVSILFSLIRNRKALIHAWEKQKKRSIYERRRPIIGIILTMLVLVLLIHTDVITLVELLQRADRDAIPIGLCVSAVFLTPIALSFISNPETVGIRKGFKTALKNLNAIVRGKRPYWKTDTSTGIDPEAEEKFKMTTPC